MTSHAVSFASTAPVRRLVRVTATQGPVARLSARFLPALDLASVRLTRGRVVLSAWLTGQGLDEPRLHVAEDAERALDPDQPTAGSVVVGPTATRSSTNRSWRRPVVVQVGEEGEHHGGRGATIWVGAHLWRG